MSTIGILIATLQIYDGKDHVIELKEEQN